MYVVLWSYIFVNVLFYFHLVNLHSLFGGRKDVVGKFDDGVKPDRPWKCWKWLWTSMCEMEWSWLGWKKWIGKL